MYTISSEGDTCEAVDKIAVDNNNLAIWHYAKLDKYTWSPSSLIPPNIGDFTFNTKKEAVKAGTAYIKEMIAKIAAEKNSEV